uniref:Uncharacterized protein n=1 Tax=Timema cristinae TaxID=61476 RepID=A0A7R9H2V8_TIMCR|nr:unnamed protein product [Timema cristinae]
MQWEAVAVENYELVEEAYKVDDVKKEDTFIVEGVTEENFDEEYTEEIERLRQDLVSAREKSGVYLSIENYNKMIAQMEQSEKEMSQKLSTIKLLNEQMEEKEVLILWK